MQAPIQPATITLLRYWFCRSDRTDAFPPSSNDCMLSPSPAAYNPTGTGHGHALTDDHLTPAPQLRAPEGAGPTFSQFDPPDARSSDTTPLRTKFFRAVFHQKNQNRQCSDDGSSSTVQKMKQLSGESTFV